MAISKKDVEHVAWLARLELTEAEKKKFAQQLSQILEHASKISELDTKEVKPTSHVVPMQNVFREDKAGTCFTQDQALSNAPKKEKGSFGIPPII